MQQQVAAAAVNPELLMHYLLVELTGGRVIEEYYDCGQALDEVVAILEEDGPDALKDLSLTWLTRDKTSGSLTGEALLKAARDHQLAAA